MGKVWFVVHRHDLLNVSDCIIGFWDKETNYKCISIGDRIIYYRAGEKVGSSRSGPGAIIGIFRVVKKAKNLCPDFGKESVQGQFLEWQCELKMEEAIQMAKREIDELADQLSFYDDWVKHLHGGGGKQVFSATQGDIDYILIGKI